MLITVDGHVHIYDCYDLDRFFSSAIANFSERDRFLGGGNRFVPVLFLAEGRRENGFGRLKNCAGEEAGALKIGNWTVEKTGESSSLTIIGDNGARIILIAGRQIVTEESLEVLALGTDSTFHDGESLSDTYHSVCEDGAIPVIPWGFGKWYGKRGLLLKKFIESKDKTPLFLGDNGGRPHILPYPYHFRLADAGGIRIIPGSDPLPFPSESWRPGSFGFTINGTIDHAKPADDMKKIILDPATRPIPYGKLENFSRFLRNQFAMQIRKRNTGEGEDSQ